MKKRALQSKAELLVRALAYIILGYAIVAPSFYVFLFTIDGDNWLHEWLERSPLFLAVLFIPIFAGATGIYGLRFCKLLLIKLSFFSILVYQILITYVNMISYELQGILSLPMITIAVIVCMLYLYFSSLDFSEEVAYHRMHDEHSSGDSAENKDSIIRKSYASIHKSTRSSRRNW